MSIGSLFSPFISFRVRIQALQGIALWPEGFGRLTKRALTAVGSRDAVQVKDAHRPAVSATEEAVKDEPSPSAALGQGGIKSHSPGTVLHFLP